MNASAMFMDKEFAAWVHHSVFLWYMKVHETTDLMKPLTSREQHRSYCRAAGRVLGFTLHEILEPIYKRHPELMPRELQWDPALHSLPAKSERPRTLPAIATMPLSEAGRAILQLADIISLNLRDIASMATLQLDPEAAGKLGQGIQEVLEQVLEWRDLMRAIVTAGEGDG